MATAQDIITRVRTQLMDPGPDYRWTDAELLRYLSDGQRAIAAAIPSASSAVITHRLVAGTRQVLPSDSHMLLNVTRNMGVSGTTPGRAVRIITRDIIDSQNPDWHSDAQKTVVYNYLYDPSDVSAFFVYPPSDGTGSVQLAYSRTPADITTLGQALSVWDIYVTALFDYVMFRAHQKDSDFAGGMVVAKTYFDAFALFLEADNTGDKEENPNLQLTPFNAQVRGAAQ